MSPEQTSPRFVRNKAVAVRRIADQLMLVPVRHDAGQAPGLYSLNETAALLWELADGEHSLEDCVGICCQRYEVDQDRARRDLAELLADLLGSKLLQKA